MQGNQLPMMGKPNVRCDAVLLDQQDAEQRVQQKHGTPYAHAAHNPAYKYNVVTPPNAVMD